MLPTKSLVYTVVQKPGPTDRNADAGTSNDNQGSDMAPPNGKRQKEARKVLDDLFENKRNTQVIHYSCESFHDRPGGRSPRITSIAVRDLATAQTSSFSIHQAAEIHDPRLADVEADYDIHEKDMLTRFFTHLSNYQSSTYLHWNMRDANYGFQAIEHRYRVLGGEVVSMHSVGDNQKVDLSRLLQDIYGSNYIGHPRMQTIVEKNDITDIDFLSGEDEAKAFEQRDYAALHASTLRKVHVFADIATMAHDRQLKTETSWWDMRGGGVFNTVKWIAAHPLILMVLAVAGVVIPVAISCR